MPSTDISKTETIALSWNDIDRLASLVSTEVCRAFPDIGSVIRVYPVPRGGIPAALALKAAVAARSRQVVLVDNPTAAGMYFDDIIDSGNTRLRLTRACGDKPFFALIDRQGRDKKDAGKWVIFPWERVTEEAGPEENVRRILQFIGEDPEREGLKETPARVVRSYAELFAGYKMDVKSVFKTFNDGTCDEMVVLKDVEFCSVCEHHMLPFVGKAHIAYIPNGKIIGVSKLARVLEVYSRRLQVQERLTEQVTTALETHLSPKGTACVIEAAHMCMQCRGVGKQHSKMVTSSLTGVLRDKPEARAEFFNIIRG